ncbi:MAG: cell division protein ZapA [Bacteroidaceae bacterium]|nr:cell division protein ZapA [Bacteroidaceae bacterium]
MEDRIVAINLVIDGVSYPMNVPQSQENLYRQAARLINEKLIKYKQHFEGEEETRLITMAAINIAYNLMTKAESISSSNVMNKVTELTRIVDDALSIE